MSIQSPEKIIDRILNYPHKEKGCSYICGPHLEPCVMIRAHDGDCECRECNANSPFRIAAQKWRENRASETKEEDEMTDEQINKLCAEAMGCCVEGLDGTDDEGVCLTCGMCIESHFIHNFCTDRNAVARLVEKCDEWTLDKAIDDLTGWTNMPDDFLSTIFVLKLPPRTIALACLVAMGKITLKEAKDANK